MRVLYFSLAVDADDPVLGFTVRWICKLAERVESIQVVTMRAGRAEVPANVTIHSVGKEKGYGEPRRALEFYKILARLLRKKRFDVCFAHMMPLFAVLAAPLLKAKGIPIVTWYAHPSVTWTLRLAHHLSRRMLASVATAYPYKHDKLTAIGQGIDTDLFSPGAAPQDEPAIVLCAGRLSPVKDHPTLIEAAWRLRQNWRGPFRVVIVGGPAAPRDEPYVRSLRQRVKQLGLEETVVFEPSVAMEELPLWYRRCALSVNMTRTGSGDKVVWEALSCGKLSLAANEGFRETFGRYADPLLFRYGDAESLAARLRWALSLSEIERGRMESYLREQVAALHSLDGLSAKLVELFSHVAAKQPPADALRMGSEACVNRRSLE